MKKYSILFGSSFAFFLSACANTPDVNLNYYLPKSTIDFKIVKSASCDTTGNLRIAASPLIETTEHSDYQGGQKYIPIKELDGAFSNTSIAVTWYDDGRLKSINSNSTGVGTNAINSITDTVISGVSLAGFRSNHCEQINATDEKTVSFTYAYKSLDSDSVSSVIGDKINLELTKESIEKRSKFELETFIPEMHDATITRSSFDLVSLGNSANNNNFLPLELRSPTQLTMSLTDDEGKPKSTNKTIAGIATYKVPIPKSAAFGTTEFALSLFPTGGIETISYGKESGLGAAADSGRTFLSKFESETAAERALNFRNEADLIAQQQRLIRCEADPSSCT